MLISPLLLLASLGVVAGANTWYQRYRQSVDDDRGDVNAARC